MTSCSTFAAKNLTSETSVRAALDPSVSIFHAACSAISRAACISAAESAIQFCTVCFSASRPPRTGR